MSGMRQRCNGKVERGFGRRRWDEHREYAIGTIAAAAFAAVLYAVVKGDRVVSALTAIVQRALSVTF